MPLGLQHHTITRLLLKRVYCLAVTTSVNRNHSFLVKRDTPLIFTFQARRGLLPLLRLFHTGHRFRQPLFRSALRDALLLTIIFIYLPEHVFLMRVKNDYLLRWDVLLQETWRQDGLWRRRSDLVHIHLTVDLRGAVSRRIVFWQGRWTQILLCPMLWHVFVIILCVIDGRVPELILIIIVC